MKARPPRPRTHRDPLPHPSFGFPDSDLRTGLCEAWGLGRVQGARTARGLRNPLRKGGGAAWNAWSQTGLGTGGFREGSPASGFMSPTPISHPWTSGHCLGLPSEVDSFDQPNPAGAQGKLQWGEEVPVQRQITGQTS